MVPINRICPVLLGTVSVMKYEIMGMPPKKGDIKSK